MTIDETIREAAEELWNERRFGSLNVFRSILTRHFAGQDTLEALVAEVVHQQDCGFDALASNEWDILREWWDATRAAVAAERDEAIWQPIETAPRDGTPILVWVPEWCRDGSPGWWITAIRGNRAGRYSFDDGDEIVFPTHWMPVPAPPTHKEGTTDAT